MDARPSDRHANYPGLDLVRFAAACLVVGYHLSYAWWEPPGNDAAFFAAGTIFHHPFRWGLVGVPIFFVLSGFVISLSANGRRPWQFLRSRVLRLYPAAWICATITLLVSNLGVPGAVWAYLCSLALWPVGPWISIVYWTLAAELVFYSLVWVMLRCRLSLNSLSATLTIVSGSFWLARAANHLSGGPLDGFFYSVDNAGFIAFMLPYGCYFAVGMLIWSINTAERFRGDRWLLLLAAIAGLLGAIAMGRAGIAKFPATPGWEALEPAIIWSIGAASILASVRWNWGLSQWLGDKPWVRSVGLLTYPLYLVHDDLGRAVAVSLVPITGHRAAIVIAFADMIILSWLLLMPERWIREQLERVWSYYRRNRSAGEGTDDRIEV